MTNAQIAGDFNGDGRVDIAADGLGLYLQDALGVFTGPAALPFGPFVSRGNWNVAADFDGDGLDDVALVRMQWASQINTVQVTLFLQRSGGLTRAYSTPNISGLDKTITQRNAMLAGDLNGDGCKDLAVITASEGVLIFHGRNCARPSAPGMAICDLREPAAVAAASPAPGVAALKKNQMEASRYQ